MLLLLFVVVCAGELPDTISLVVDWTKRYEKPVQRTVPTQFPGVAVDIRTATIGVYGTTVETETLAMLRFDTDVSQADWAQHSGRLLREAATTLGELFGTELLSVFEHHADQLFEVESGPKFRNGDCIAILSCHAEEGIYHRLCGESAWRKNVEM